MDNGAYSDPSRPYDYGYYGIGNGWATYAARQRHCLPARHMVSRAKTACSNSASRIRAKKAAHGAAVLPRALEAVIERSVTAAPTTTAGRCRLSWQAAQAKPQNVLGTAA